jgi:hypothetical protein
MFFMGQCRTFPRGAARHNAVGAHLNMPIDKFAQGIFIQKTVAEGRDERNN